MNIKEFKKGIIITRDEPVKERTSDGMAFGIMGGSREENNYTLVGKPVKLLGVANGMIYYHHYEGLEIKKEREPCSIVYDKFKDGWSQYIDPNTL